MPAPPQLCHLTLPVLVHQVHPWEQPGLHLLCVLAASSSLVLRPSPQAAILTWDSFRGAFVIPEKSAPLLKTLVMPSLPMMGFRL